MDVSKDTYFEDVDWFEDTKVKNENDGQEYDFEYLPAFSNPDITTAESTSLGKSIERDYSSKQIDEDEYGMDSSPFANDYNQGIKGIQYGVIVDQSGSALEEIKTDDGGVEFIDD